MKTPLLDLNRLNADLAIAFNQRTLKTLQADPTANVLDLERLSTEDVKEFLQTLGTQEWGRRSIIDEELLDAAAEWFISQVTQLHQYLLEKQSRENRPVTNLHLP